MRYTVGVDLGGTNIKVGIVELDGRTIVASDSVKTNAPRSCEDISADIAALIRSLTKKTGISKDDILWIGVATPGIVKNDTVISAVNLGWSNTPFAEILRRITSKPVFLANDANAAAYAEALWGVGQGSPSLVAITLGTGVGGGIVINGNIWDGFNGFAAEIGHMVIRAEGRECPCGKRGCLEAYCSATGLIRETRRMMSLYPDSKMWDICGGDINAVDGRTAFSARRDGDFAAGMLTADFIDNLAYGISNVINVFQPSVVCIGGGISNEGDALMLPLRDRVMRLSFGLRQGRTRVEVAKFKNDAGIIGASLLGLQEKENENMSVGERICKKFRIVGEVSSCEPYGNGHINDTYKIITKVNGGEKKYILQRINKNVFKRPDLLMDNFAKVTSYLADIIKKEGGDPIRGTLNVIESLDEKSYYLSEDGDYWRMLIFIEDSISFNKVESPEQFYECAVAFGDFQSKLRDFPAEELVETIPNFHNTPDRLRQLNEAVALDKFERLASVMPEVEFARAREEFIGLFEREHAAGRLPLKVTHNDTKLNNILYDKDTKKPVCVIDLDTIMPGYAINDFGDSIRFGATTALEDEADLSKVNFDIGLFELYVKGFIEGADGGLTATELSLLPESAIMMTLECGMRFLTDYLSGDTYFKTSREGQNLDRARNQFKLVSDMEKALPKMHEIVNKYSQI
ncbi:MAG: ROK family protein [Clostridia bacterium]|nr:ROK family protein [Clostridia bacterium]